MRKIAIAELKITNEAKKLIKKVLDSNRLTYGPVTEKFEQEFAKIHNRKFALFMNSGTSALQVALHALKEYYKWKDGDEVLVPAITFVASSNVIIQNNLKPVFVDVDPDYYEIDPNQIEKHITKRTRAIMPVHLFGQSCDMDIIMHIAKKYNLRVIEDSCESLFTRYKGKFVGSLGDVSCYSTYVAHFIVTGVGGLACTNYDNLAILMRRLMFHGRDKIYLKIEDDDTKNPKKLLDITSKRFQFEHIGYSYRATEMEAALGLVELRKWKNIISKRQKNANYLTSQLEKFSHLIQLPKIRPNTEHGFMLYPIVIKSKKINREKLILFLETHGIETRYMMPLLNQPIYKKLFGNLERKYPMASKIDKQGFIIGCHNYLSREDLDYVVSVFSSFFN